MGSFSMMGMDHLMAFENDMMEMNHLMVFENAMMEMNLQTREESLASLNPIV